MSWIGTGLSVRFFSGRRDGVPRDRQSGQGMTEYIIVVALVAIAAIGVYQYLGQVLRAQTAAIAKELAGEDGAQQTRAAQTAAQAASAQSASKTLSDFTGQSQGASR